ncbi:MAG: hypothetical protein V4608_04235 [Bacteroidota bacterium]
MKLKSIIFLLSVFGFLSSCMVTNNLYVNDPTPMIKGKGKAYVGLGTGLKPKIDSISADKKINFSNKIEAAPILSFGGQIGLGEHMNVRIAGHLPGFIGGFGLRAGTQYGFFDRTSKFNAAIGVDLGFVTARDSIRIFGNQTAVSVESKLAYNADFFIPISYKFNKDFMLILTPRYSYTNIEIKKYTTRAYSTNLKVYSPIVSLGMRYRHLYLETSVVHYDNRFYPNFGIAGIF